MRGCHTMHNYPTKILVFTKYPTKGACGEWQEAHCAPHGRWFDPRLWPTRPSTSPGWVNWYQRDWEDEALSCTSSGASKSLYRHICILCPYDSTMKSNAGHILRTRLIYADPFILCFILYPTNDCSTHCLRKCHYVAHGRVSM